MTLRIALAAAIAATILTGTSTLASAASSCERIAAAQMARISRMAHATTTTSTGWVTVRSTTSKSVRPVRHAHKI